MKSSNESIDPSEEITDPDTAIIDYCDHCGRGLTEKDRFCFASLKKDVSSANAGESGTLCGACVRTTQ